MKDCIFCKIINGEIPCHKIYEDQNALAFLDISKQYYGHTLVIPKKHYKNILEIPANELAEIMNVVQKISQHYIQNCGFEGINIANNNEECAHQSVFHLHIHIIPRKTNDNVKLYADVESLDLDLEDICKKLKIN